MTFQSIFITGTDTGVGKTTVACGIAAALRQRGLRVCVFKPSETGCLPDQNGRLLPEDAQRLKYFSECDFDLSALCRYVLSQPLAPAVAAQHDGVSIDLDALVRAHGSIADVHDITLIEGAGGLLVPLTGTLTFADLALCLHTPVLVVVGSRLGAINHALLTVRAVRSIGLHVLGYVVNTLSTTPDLAAQTNERVLRDWLGPAIGTVPHLGLVEMTEADRQRLAAVFAATINLDALLRHG